MGNNIEWLRKKTMFTHFLTEIKSEVLQQFLVILNLLEIVLDELRHSIQHAVLRHDNDYLITSMFSML